MTTPGKLDSAKVSEHYKDNNNQRSLSGSSPLFKVADNLKSEYDMWGFIFSEIANLRMEVSRVATFVRMNNQSSPQYLEAYHAQLYGLLVPISVVIPDEVWGKIYKEWRSVGDDINSYMLKRRTITNLKIHPVLIRRLDEMYRIALLAAQKGGLGIKITIEHDINAAIESAITGA